MNRAQLEKVIAVLGAESHVHFDNIVPNWLVATSTDGEVIELSTGKMIGLHWTINTSESKVWEGPDIEMVLLGDMHMFVLDLLEIKYCGQPAAIYRTEWEKALKSNQDWMSEHSPIQRHELWPAVYDKNGDEWERSVLLAVNLYFGELRSIQRFIDNFGTASESVYVHDHTFIEDLAIACKAVDLRIELEAMDHYPQNDDGTFADEVYDLPKER